jgi:hypothetical protein
MRAKTFTFALLVMVLALTAACAAEGPASNDTKEGITGRWSGQYEVGGGRSEPIAVDLRWQEPNLSGSVLAGMRSLPLTKASYAPDSGAITMEFDTEGNGGRTVHYVIEGKISGDTMTGSWTHDGQRGDFKVRKE